MYGKGNPFTIDELPAGKLKEQLQQLSPQARGKAMQWLHTLQFAEFDAADHLRVDKDGGVFIVCPDGKHACKGCNHKHQHEDQGPIVAGPADGDSSAPVESADVIVSNPEVPITEGAAVPIDSPPAYNSKPGAPYHIYMDFNGAYVTGKAWSETDGVTTWTTWDCHAWSSDGDRTTFSDAEQTYIRQMWERVAEDYRPFNVNVTTDRIYDPEYTGPDKYTGDRNKVGWLLTTPTTDKTGARCPHYGSGGVAYVGVFGNSNFFSTYQPAWVTDMSVPNIAEAASHEMGHNMGLSHDGTSTQTYYGGHVATSTAPSWGPIMGTGYSRNVSQWSKSTEYYDGNQTQDDFPIISGRVPYRTDEHGDNAAGATFLSESTVNVSSVIERNTDADFFVFTSGAGAVSFSGTTYKCEANTWGANLDILLELYDKNLNLLASSGSNDADVNATLNYTLPTSGEYYIAVKGAGCGDPNNTTRSGYTSYGSVGQYTLTGNFVPTDSIVLTSPNGGEVWTLTTIKNITWSSGMGGNVKIELYKNGVYHSDIKSSTPNDGVFEWLIPNSLAVAADYKVKVTSVENATVSDISFANFSLIAPTNNILVTNLDTDPGFTRTGLFEYGVPVSPNKPAAAYTGTKIYDTDLDNTCWQESTLTTMALDCSKHENVTLSFWANKYVYIDYTIKFEVSNDGTNWTQLYSVTGDTTNTWTQYNYTTQMAAVADRQPTVYVRWSMLGSGSQYSGAGLAIDDISITGTFVPDAPPYGVTIAQTDGSTDVTEGGNTDTYTLVLDTQPAPGTTVTINIAGDPDVSVLPTSVSFNDSNWDTPKQVTVTAVQDSVHELLHTGTITHTATGTDSNYVGIPIANLTVNVTDDDNNAPTVNAGADQFVDLEQVGGDPVAGAHFEWDAAADSAGDNLWTSTTANAYNWQFDSGSLSPVNVNDARFGTLTKAYAFPAAQDASNTSWDGFGSNQPATFEFVIDVDGTDGSIFECGGSGDGLQVDMVGGVLRGTVQETTPARVQYALTPTDFGRFIHVVFVADSANDVVQLYVDGVLKDSVAWTGPDWAGTDSASLGEQAGSMPTGGSTAAFTGKMALFRYYKNKAFTQGDVTTNFDSIAGTSVTVSLNGQANDQDSDPLSVQWTHVGGTGLGTVTFANANAAVTTADIDAEGTYLLRLTATDSIDVVFDECLITVNPPTPFSVAIVESGGSTAVSEDGAQDTYTIVLGAPPGTTNNVTINISGGVELNVTPNSVVFDQNNWNQPRTITVSAIDDNDLEGNHTGTITHTLVTTDPDYSAIQARNIVASIADNDDPGTLSLGSVSETISESGTSITLTVSRSGGSKGAASVNYATANGTATAGSDYTAKNGTLNWANGDTADKQITINITGDQDPENNENFTVTLSGQTGAFLGSPAATTITIQDDDIPGSLALTSATYNVAEAGGSVTISVARSGGSAGTVSVNYATANGTAVQPGDYTSRSGGLTWGPGDSAVKTFTVPVINDADAEADETFTVSLTLTSAYGSLGSQSSATITIADDDFSPNVIPQLVGWYDAQDFTAAAGSNVTSWPDKTGGSNTTANNLAQVTGASGGTAVAPKLQTVNVNGGSYKSVRFLPGSTGQYELLKAPLLVANGDLDRTVIAVFKGGTDAVESRPMCFGSEVDGVRTNKLNFWCLGTDGNGSMYFGTNGQNDRLINSHSAGLTRTDFMIRTSVMKTGTAYDEFIDVLDSSFTDTQVLTNGNPGAVPAPLGDFYVGDTTLVGGTGQPSFDVLEILVFDKALSDAERNQVQDYLKTKYTPAPVANFVISGIGSSAVVNTPINGITITAKDAGGATVDSFTGTVDFGGSAGITGTSANFVAGVLTGLSVTPINKGSSLTFSVQDASGATGTAVFNVLSVFDGWDVGGAGFNGDSNGDGIPDGLAWALGASSPGVGAHGLLPVADSNSDPGFLIFNYRRLDAANDDPNISIVAEFGSDLGVWTPASHDGTNTIINTYNDDYGPGVDRVEVKLKKSAFGAGGKLFSRLKVTQAP